MNLNDIVQLETRTTVQTATGQTEVWKPVQRLYARVVPLSVQTRASYQQLNSKVSYQVVIKGTITLNSDYRFKWKDKTLTPAEPPKYIKETTVIMVNE